MDNQREREGNINKGNSRDRKHNTKKSKSNLQAIQRNRKDTQIKEIWKTQKRTEREIEAIKDGTRNTDVCDRITKNFKQERINISKSNAEVLRMNGYANEEKNKRKKPKPP